MKRRGLVVLALAAAFVLGSSMASFAAGGWASENGKWVYYDNSGALVVNEWKKGADNLWRYLNSSGQMAVSSWVDEVYYVDENGVMVSGKWMQLNCDNYGMTDDYHWYYFADNGKAVTDAWKKINNKWYHFDGDGKMETGWIEDDMYYAGEDGAVLIGWHKLYPPEDQRDDYSDPFDEDEGRKWYYFNSSGKKYTPAEDSSSDYVEKRIDGVYYCFDENGVMQTGWVYMGTGDAASAPITEYRFYGSDGKGVLGWYSAEPPEELGTYDSEVDWYYFSKSGVPKGGPEEGDATTSDFLRVNNKTYLFNYVGNPVSGLQRVYTSKSKTDYTAYYFDENTRTVWTGKKTVEEGDGSTCTFYFTESGKGYTGVKDGYLYYMGKLQKAESGTKYQPITVPGFGTYLVNASGKVTKSTSGVKDSNGTKFATNSTGILTKVNDEAVDTRGEWRAAEEPIWAY